jgi:PHD/YefM family antitoxin component YafN of YafNO toxin-antitoxin module
MAMQRVPSTDAQNELQFVLNQVCGGLGPVLITGLQGNAVLVSEADWHTIQKNLARLEEPEKRGSRSEGGLKPDHGTRDQPLSSV